MKILIPIIVGAIIGYLTNWLAIKMLFKPHNKVKLFGIKLLFTPGLIPKERYRISENIGNTIGEYLLTPEKIKEVLYSDETKAGIIKSVDNRFTRLKQNNQTILEILDILDLFDYNTAIHKLNIFIVNKLMTKLKSDEFKNILIDHIEINIYDKSKDIILENFKDTSNNFLYTIFKSKEIRSFTNDVINDKINNFQESNRLLREVLPEEITDNIYKNIYMNKSNLVSLVKKLLHEESTRKWIKTNLDNLVNENINTTLDSIMGLFTAKFLSSEIISDKLYNGFYDYLDSEKSDKMIMVLIDNSLDKFMNTKLSDFTSIIKKYTMDDNIIKFNYLFDLAEDSNFGDILDPLINILKSKDEQIRNTLLEQINIHYEEFIDMLDLSGLVYNIFDTSIKNILSQPISSLLDNIHQDHINSSIEFISNISYKLGEESFLDIINIFNITEIIKEEIDEFSTEYMEDLILNIASKELKAITNLGALLGGIMGLLAPLLQTLM